MNKFIVSIWALLFCASAANAQLFEQKDFYPDVKTVKAKYYNGSGGGFRSVEKLDDPGRVAEREYYSGNQLRSRQQLTYNPNNDRLYQIETLDINYPGRVDMTIRYEYEYREGRIVRQKSYHTASDSIVILLIGNEGDTCLVYQSKSYIFRPKTNTADVHEKRYTANYSDGLLIRLEAFDVDKNSKETTHYEYYPNGKLKRRKIERDPEPAFKVMYTGGPGGDDMYYEYKFDKSGRIRTLYHIVDAKRYKIATYRYYTE